LTSAGHDDRFLRRKAVALFAFTLYSSGRKTGLILKNVKSSESQTKKKDHRCQIYHPWPGITPDDTGAELDLAPSNITC
jgi:hypothetical protein